MPCSENGRPRHLSLNLQYQLSSSEVTPTSSNQWRWHHPWHHQSGSGECRWSWMTSLASSSTATIFRHITISYLFCSIIIVGCFSSCMSLCCQSYRVTLPALADFRSRYDNSVSEVGHSTIVHDSCSAHPPYDISSHAFEFQIDTSSHVGRGAVAVSVSSSARGGACVGSWRFELCAK